jgi:signal transduction histidine kinase/ligand-binding sensor domain-containing protein
MPPAAHGAEEDSVAQYYTVKVWGADEGLTEGSVTDAGQTPEGYLWVGTVFGSVLRFDGIRFVSYNSANTPEFLLKWGVPRLMVDQSGTLWISMHDGGLTTWDKQGFHSAFSRIEQPDRLVWSAPGRVVFAFGDGRLLSGRKNGEAWDWETVVPPGSLPVGQECADASGRIWYLRGEREIGIWDGKTFQTLPPQPALDGRQIKVLTADAQGHIWAGTDRSLLEWQTDHFADVTPTNGESRIDVQRIIPSGATNLWVQANGRMRRCLGRQWVVESMGWNRAPVNTTALRFIHGDAEGGLWAAGGDLGLIHVLPDGTFHRLTTREGLPSNTLRFAYQDRDGNTWTGYERGGLVRVRRRFFRVIGKEEGLANSLVNTVCQDTKGGVWIGMHDGEIGHYENGVCTNLFLPQTAHAQDSCVTVDAEGRVCIGAQGAGLVRFESSGEMKTIATMAQLQSYPRLLLARRNGEIWVGTTWSLFSISNGNFNTEYTATTVGEHPTALAEAADGTVWAGTLAGLILRREGTNFVTLEPPQHELLGRVWALWPAPDGSVWAGTEVGGLLHWTQGQFYRYTMKDGLPSDSIVQVLGDVAGNIWLGTRAGLARVFGAALARHEKGELSEIPVSVYGTADGLLTIGSAIIFQPNCWRAPDGNLFFAMANSVASVTPGDIHINPVQPSVALEEVRADDTVVFPARVGAILAASQSATLPSIKISPGRGDLEFRYTGLSLSSPLRVRFKYKLEGLENSWNEATVERKASYRHVPPGNYVFRVSACNSDGVCSDGAGLLAITIEPYFYQTGWFRAEAVLLLAAALTLTVVVTMRHRLQRRLRESERQQQLERERTRIAQDLHDDLGAGLTEIGLLGGMLRNREHFEARERDALGRIVQRCHDLVMALDEIVWAVNPRHDSFNSLGNYLCRYAQGFLEPTSIRCRLEMAEADVDVHLSSEQRHNFFLAFEEALANIVKHSGATEARIQISLEARSRLVIRLDDNGRGLPATVPEGCDGLNNLKQRMTQIGGQCEIANRPEGGVAVTLSLRL